jgi:hypothetical protein
MENGDTVDGVVLATNDRVLLRGQSTDTENGIYVVQATGAGVRSEDANAAGDFATAKQVKGTEGTSAGKVFEYTGNVPPTLGVDTLSFVERGAIEKQGVITSDPNPALVSSIYSVDASGGAFNFTLPAASGSQDFIYISASDVQTNNVTIAVQSGEDLNDVTDGTFILQTNGQTLLAIDRASGKWDIQVVGAGTTTLLHRVRMRRAAAQLIPDVTDTDILLDTEDYDVGGIGNTTTGLVTIAQAGLYQITAKGYASVGTSNNNQIYIEVNGAKVARAVNAQTTGGQLDNQTVITTQELSVGDTVGMGVFQGSGAAQNTDTLLTDQPTLEVIQLPDTEVVPAGNLVAEDIHKLSINGGDGANATVDGLGAYDIFPISSLVQHVYNPNSLWNGTDNYVTITAATAGEYFLTLSVAEAGSSQELNIRKNGVIIAEGRSDTANNVSNSIHVTETFSAGDTIEWGIASTTATNFNRINITATQLPTKTLVAPEGASVVEWTNYSPTIGATTTAPTTVFATQQGSYKQIGKTLEVNVFLLASGAGNAAGTGKYTVPLPAGYTIDTTKVTAESGTGNNAHGTIIGSAHTDDASNGGLGVVYPHDTTSVSVLTHFSSETSSVQWGSTRFAWSDNAKVSLSFKVPIT